MADFGAQQHNERPLPQSLIAIAVICSVATCDVKELICNSLDLEHEAITLVIE